LGAPPPKSDDDARREICVPHRELARGGEHCGVVALLMEKERKLDVDRIAALPDRHHHYSAGGASINACLALERLTGTSFCTRGLEVARFKL
jgi:hypothetical protein